MLDKIYVYYLNYKNLDIKKYRFSGGVCQEILKHMKYVEVVLEVIANLRKTYEK